MTQNIFSPWSCVEDYVLSYFWQWSQQNASRLKVLNWGQGIMVLPLEVPGPKSQIIENEKEFLKEITRLKNESLKHDPSILEDTTIINQFFTFKNVDFSIDFFVSLYVNAKPHNRQALASYCFCSPAHKNLPTFSFIYESVREKTNYEASRVLLENAYPSLTQSLDLFLEHKLRSLINTLKKHDSIEVIHSYLHSLLLSQNPTSDSYVAMSHTHNVIEHYDNEWALMSDYCHLPLIKSYLELKQEKSIYLYDTSTPQWITLPINFNMVWAKYFHLLTISETQSLVKNLLDKIPDFIPDIQASHADITNGDNKILFFNALPLNPEMTLPHIEKLINNFFSVFGNFYNDKKSKGVEEKDYRILFDKLTMSYEVPSTSPVSKPLVLRKI